MTFFDIVFWNNRVLDYVLFLASLIVSIAILLIIKRILLKRLAKWAEKTPTSLDDMLVRSLRKHLMPLLYVAAFYFNLKWLTIAPAVQRIFDVVALAFVIIFGAVLVSTALIFLFNKYLEKRDKKTDKLAMRWISALIKILIWVAALLLFLENLGVEITALVAGLGIGGIAIAFAAQAVLEDVFSFVTIFFDRPFEIDDFIVVDDMAGNVEHIGIKTTRIRSLSGEQLVFSNKDLTSSRIRNYKRMQNRRIAFTLGVTYDTDAGALRSIPQIIKDIIEGIEDVTFDRTHFKEFADSSLNFEIVYYVLSQDYALYMDLQQQINLKIKQVFDEKGIEFAYPTQTIYLEK